MLDQITNGRTDLVFDYLAQGHPADAADDRGVSLMQWCAYYGEVSAIRFLLSQGAKLESLGENLDHPLADTGETPLHSALCKTDRQRYNPVLKILLDAGANPNCATIPHVETGSFMRDCRTKGETPLHRAAAFGDERAIQMLLDAGAKIDAPDVYNDTPLSWASWYLRPRKILRQLCYGSYRVSPGDE